MLQDEKGRRETQIAVFVPEAKSQPGSESLVVQLDPTEFVAWQPADQQPEPIRRPVVPVGEMQLASFRLLNNQGLINNGREMVAYRGPFQCRTDGCQAVISNVKVLVRHWNVVHR